MTEMLIVVGIISLLLLLGIGTYIGTQRDSQDTVARSNLTRMVATQAQYRSGYGEYGTLSSQFDQLPEGLDLVGANPSTKASEISADVDAEGNLGMAAWSDASETCFYVHVVGGADASGNQRSGVATDGQAGGPESGFDSAACVGSIAFGG